MAIKYDKVRTEMDHPVFSHSFDVHHEKPDHHQSSTLNGSQVVLFGFEV